MLKVKKINESRYTVNGMTILATNFKEAIKEYLFVHSGSTPIFASKG